jgi:hypothetical protein
MSNPIVAAHTRNGNGHHPVALTATGLAWLGEAVDRLAAMRAEKRRLDTASAS